MPSRRAISDIDRPPTPTSPMIDTAMSSASSIVCWRRTNRRFNPDVEVDVLAIAIDYSPRWFGATQPLDDRGGRSPQDVDLVLGGSTASTRTRARCCWPTVAG